ncbi:MAG TPA: uroporphyrinogen decarboxylase family protein [Anaerolineales bacterium]|nr:uroporphyrinogen decarboxylase family protein [Anaerolineales bacterium]
MDPKQRILDTFALRPTDHVPSCLFGAGMWTFRNTGTNFRDLLGKPEAMARAYLDGQKKSGQPIVYVGSGYNNFHAAAYGGQIKFRQIGAPDLEAPIVKETADELDAINIDDLAKDELVQTVWEATRIVAREIGDTVAVTATAWGPFTLGAQMYGVEKLMRAVYRKPHEVDKVVDFALRVIQRFYQPLLDEGVISMLSIADPTASGDLVSRKHFERFALPPLRRLTDWGRAHSVVTLLHICGNTTDKIDLLVATGAECVSIDHKVDIATAKPLFAGKACLAGNVDPVKVLDRGTREDVERNSFACLEAAAAGGGFMLMPGCDIPPTVPVENVEAFIQAPLRWKSAGVAAG